MIKGGERDRRERKPPKYREAVIDNSPGLEPRMERLEGSRFSPYPKTSQILSSARKAKTPVKQAAPGNYPARGFVQRSVRLFHFTYAQETNYALGHSREPPVKENL